MTLDEVKAILAAYFQTFPKIKNFIDNAHKMARTNGFVFTKFGQRKMEAGAMDLYKGTAVHNAALRNAQNVLIQSTASTLGLMAFTQVNTALKKLGGGVMCTVYDSIEAYVPIPRIAEAVEIGFRYMDDWPQKEFDWLTFPIGADAEIGFDWGDSLKKVHRGVTQEECLELLSHANHERFLAEAA